MVCRGQTGTRGGGGGSICTSRNNWNNKFGDIRFSYRAEWDLRDTDWLVTIGPCPDAPGIYIPLGRNALLSCLDVMQMKGFRRCAIMCCDIHDVPLRCFSARVAGMGVVACAGAVIQVTVLSCLEGSPWERSE